MELTCFRCGKDFNGRQGTKYCGNACRQWGARARKELKLQGAALTQELAKRVKETRRRKPPATVYVHAANCAGYDPWRFGIRKATLRYDNGRATWSCKYGCTPVGVPRSFLAHNTPEQDKRWRRRNWWVQGSWIVPAAEMNKRIGEMKQWIAETGHPRFTPEGAKYAGYPLGEFTPARLHPLEAKPCVESVPESVPIGEFTPARLHPLEAKSCVESVPESVPRRRRRRTSTKPPGSYRDLTAVYHVEKRRRKHKKK